MQTDQARRIIALHDQHDRALANLRNAAAMSTDDPRATELLEEAGDAYAEATANLARGSAEAFERATELQPSGSAPGAEDPATGASQVQPEADRGTPAEARETIPVPRSEAPADAAGGSETASEASGRGDTPEDA